MDDNYIKKVGIERGNLADDEYCWALENMPTCQISTEDGSEVFWAIILDEKHFVFANNPLRFLFLNMVGRIGIHNNNGVMLDKETVDFCQEKDKQK